MTDVYQFIKHLDWDQLPKEVQKITTRCLLDTIGVAFAGVNTKAAKIAKEVAIEEFGANKKSCSRLIAFSGVSSVVGAAMAGGYLIDSVDAHDGHSMTKGHAGASVVPALIALSDNLIRQGKLISGKMFLEALLIGYEVSLRNGIILHKTSKEYHTSGAWTAIGIAAMASYLYQLSHKTTQHALGIAEYNGPRSPMMRCIDYPTMVKDGAGFGALAGVSAVSLARKGFTGGPPMGVKNECEQDYFSRYEVLKQYFKPWPVCRWAHPAIAAVEKIMQIHTFKVKDIKNITIKTFHNATRLGNKHPKDTEQAQYSLGFSVCAMLYFGKLTVKEVSGKSLSNSNIIELQKKLTIAEEETHSQAFPRNRFASVVVTMENGTVLNESDVQAKGDYDHLSLTDKEINDKFKLYSKGYLGKKKTKRMKKIIENLASKADISELLDLICADSRKNN